MFLFPPPIFFSFPDWLEGLPGRQTLAHLPLSLQQTDTWSLRHRPGLSGVGTAVGNWEEGVRAENHPLVLGCIRPSFL